MKQTIARFGGGLQGEARALRVMKRLAESIPGAALLNNSTLSLATSGALFLMRTPCQGTTDIIREVP